MNKARNSDGKVVAVNRIKSWIKVAERFTEDVYLSEADLIDLSPVDVELAPDKLLAALMNNWVYAKGDKLNIVTDYVTKDGRVMPNGWGNTKSIPEWIEHFATHGVPSGEAGAWIRPNPMDGKGIDDANVTRGMIVVLESDYLPKELQIRVLAQLELPIIAIIDSGGKSLHAWVEISARDLQRYRYLVGRIYRWVEPLGFDPKNKNPSRLSRLFGVNRVLGAQGQGRQRLLYLNPEPIGTAIYAK